MSTRWTDIARATLDGTEAGTMSFSESVRLLKEAGFDGYAVDLRRPSRTYYRPNGEAIALETAAPSTPVAERFDSATVVAAIREAQAQVPGYTYERFCAKVAGAGCAGYLVSFPGNRVLYFGRTGETHTEHFPAARPAGTP